MMYGLVSTIIPVRNRPQLLREAVASVLAQDYRPIEVIVVDDGSTDETLGVARALGAEHPGLLKVVSQANAGPGAARERGRSMAQGEFIQYLDSDDLLLPGKFSAQVAALRSDPQAQVAYGITLVREADGVLRQGPHKKTGQSMAAMFPEFLVSRWWETATPLYRRSVTDEAGPWTDLSLEEDWEYDCRIASRGGRLTWVPQPVSEHRDHTGTRLSRGAAVDAVRLRQRSRAHALVLEHASRFGLGPECEHMKQFARSLFLLSRQCGAAGLGDDSRRLFALSRKASLPARSNALDFRIYAGAARLVGWTTVGKLSCWLDLLRRTA
jgi:glycosyltransferase involved in cell wall biosynthesis